MTANNSRPGAAPSSCRRCRPPRRAGAHRRPVRRPRPGARRRPGAVPGPVRPAVVGPVPPFFSFPLHFSYLLRTPKRPGQAGKGLFNRPGPTLAGIFRGPVWQNPCLANPARRGRCKGVSSRAGAPRAPAGAWPRGRPLGRRRARAGRRGGPTTAAHHAEDPHQLAAAPARGRAPARRGAGGPTTAGARGPRTGTGPSTRGPRTRTSSPGASPAGAVSRPGFHRRASIARPGSRCRRSLRPARRCGTCGRS